MLSPRVKVATEVNAASSRILVAVDDADHVSRTLRYIGTLLRDAPNVHITLFHVLRPMPPKFLEHGGSEDPGEEARLSCELKIEQASWVKSEGLREYPILSEALVTLCRTGFPVDRVQLKFGYQSDIADNILEEARNGGHGTIVVTRQGSNGLKRFFVGGTTDKLLRDATGFTLWVVE